MRFLTRRKEPSPEHYQPSKETARRAKLYYAWKKGDTVAGKMLDDEIRQLAKANTRFAKSQLDDLLYDLKRHYFIAYVYKNFPELRMSITRTMHDRWINMEVWKIKHGVATDPIVDLISLDDQVVECIYYHCLNDVERKRRFKERFQAMPTERDTHVAFDADGNIDCADGSAKGPDQQVFSREMLEHVQKLPEKNLRIIVRHWYMEESLEKTAERLGLSVAEVRCLWRKTISLLADYLRGFDEDSNDNDQFDSPSESDLEGKAPNVLNS
jgi:hypothetical protein